MPWDLANKVCIAGIGETEYTRWGQATKSETRLAFEAIINAVADAGVAMDDIDGFASYASERQEPIYLASALGIKQLRYESLHWGGGGGGMPGGVMNAMLAVATGTARYAVAYRSLAQGQFGRFGQMRGPPLASGANAFTAPWGLVSAPAMFAVRAQRYMHEYGVTSRQFAEVALASYAHAQNNPHAVMHGRPLTLEDHQNSRMIADPLHLFDCCLESDGACAVVLTTPERARDLKQKPVYILSASQGSGYRNGTPANNQAEYTTSNFTAIAADLWERAGIGPKDVDVAQFYENFTPMVLMAMEDHGFCKRGEAGAFAQDGNLRIGGKLPINTSGGNMAEGYIHGLEHVIEGVRQMRGTSSNQVAGAETCLVVGGPGVAPASSLLLRRA